MSKERPKKKRTVEERLDQIEKDIEQLADGYRKLLTWKRNQAVRTLPTRAPKKGAYAK